MYVYDTNKLKGACFPKNFATRPADCQTLTHKHRQQDVARQLHHEISLFLSYGDCIHLAIISFLISPTNMSYFIKPHRAQVITGNPINTASMWATKISVNNSASDQM